MKGGNTPRNEQHKQHYTKTMLFNPRALNCGKALKTTSCSKWDNVRTKINSKCKGKRKIVVKRLNLQMQVNNNQTLLTSLAFSLDYI